MLRRCQLIQVHLLLFSQHSANGNSLDVHHPVIIKDEIMKFTGKWTDLETIILGGVTQIQKDKCHTISHLWILTSTFQMCVLH